MKNKLGQYAYVPAAIYYPMVGGFRIYVKYKSHSKNKIELVESNPRYMKFRCPDREIMLVGNDRMMFNDEATMNPYPMEPYESYDECIDPTIFNNDVARASNVKYYMYNYPQHIPRPSESPRNRRGLSNVPGDPQIIADSGGFQLSATKYEYLDPKKIIEWYNENCDLGMILDIPYGGNDVALHKRLAKVQAKNTEELLKGKKPSLELINIFRGKTEEIRNLYYKYCERKDIDRLAIASSYYQSILTSVDSIYEALARADWYKHAHILGISDISRIPHFVKMAEMGVMKSITADSSSFIQKAVRFVYCLQSSPTSSLTGVELSAQSYACSPNNILPCSCPVCYAIKYQDIFASRQHNVVSLAFIFHNLYASNYYCDSLYDMCINLPHEEFKRVIKNQLSGLRGSTREESLQALDFLEDVKNYGHEAASKKYKYYLSSLKGSEGNHGLFDSGTESSDRENYIKKLLDIYESGDTSKVTHGKEIKKKGSAGHSQKLGVTKPRPGMSKMLKKVANK